MATKKVSGTTTSGTANDSGTNSTINWVEASTAGVNVFAVQSDATSAKILLNGTGDNVYIEGFSAEYQIKASGKTVTLKSDMQTITIILNSASKNGGVTDTLSFLDGSVALADVTNRKAVAIKLGTQALTTKFVDVTTALNENNSDASNYFDNANSGGTTTTVGSYTLTAVAADVEEGSPVTFTLTLDKAPTETVTVAYNTVADTATTADYTSVAGTVTFAAGQTTAFVTVATVDDKLIEQTESLKLNVTGTQLKAAATGTARITDALDNATPPVTIQPLTTSIDTVNGTAGNDTINAPVASGSDTFSALDIVDGGAGTDTFNLITTGAISAAGATVSNVEIANVISSAAITAADVSGWTGLQTLNVISGAAISGVKASATTDVNVASGLAGVSVDGGKNVTITNGTAGSIAVGATTAAAGNVTATNNFTTGTVGLKGTGALTATAKDGAIAFTNGTSVSANTVDAVALATRTANVAAQTAANTANTAALADSDTSGLAKVVAATKVTTLSTLATAIAAATNVSANQATALSIQAATKTAYAASGITLAEKVAIDAAFKTGLVTSAAAARTAAQAVLTPLQTAAATASTAAIAADVTHDNAVAAALTAAAAVVTADGAKAALVDGVTVTATTNTALTSATVIGNYGSTNTITDGSTAHNTLTTVTLENAAATTATGLAIANVSATGMTDNVTVTNTTASHTETFTLSGVTAGTYQDSNATTVNVVSNGSATNVLTGLSATLATKVNLSGAAGLTFGTTTFDAAAVIDASASSGTNTISLLLGQKYTGGSGVDIVTATTTATAQAVTVDGGAGTADRLILADTSGINFGTATAAAKYLNFEILQTDISADISKFTGSTFTSIIMAGTTTLDALNATQAANIKVINNAVPTLNITGAATVGQLDTVRLTIDDDSTTVNTITLGTPVLTGVETLNLVATDNVSIAALTSATALTNVTATGAGTVSITSGVTPMNVNSVFDASAVNSAVTLNFALATGNGVSLKAGNGNNTLTGTDVATKGNSIVSGNGNSNITGGQADDVITAGNGNNTIDAAAGANTITVGNGDNTIAVTGSISANTITAGNGINVITGGAGIDTIVVGTGGNLITGGVGGDKITFGTHAAGVLDGVVITAAGQTFSAGVTSGTTVLTGADIVTGLKAGDTISLEALTADAYTAGAVVTTIALSTAGAIGVVRGDYVASTGIFTASATGADSIVEYDNDGTGVGTTIETIVLVGFAGTASTTTADGLITLG